MKKSIFLGFMLLLSFSLWGASKQVEAPDWYMDLKSVYPKNEFFSETGCGPTVEQAKADAVNNIARYFEQKVESVAQSNTKAAQAGEKSVVKRSLDATVIVRSNVNLFAIEFTEPYYIKKEKKYYIAAYYSYDEAYKIFKPQIEKPCNAFDEFYNAAQNEDGKLTKYQYLVKAKAIAPDFEEKYIFLLMLSPENAKNYSNSYQNLLALDVEMTKTLLDCQFNILVEEDLNDSVKSAVSAAVGEKGYSVASSNGNCNIEIKVNLNEQTLSSGTRLTPFVNVSLVENGKTLYIVGGEAGKSAAVNVDVAKKRAFTQIVPVSVSLIDDLFYKLHNN